MRTATLCIFQLLGLYFCTGFLCALFSAELCELKVLCVDRKFASKMENNAKKNQMITIDIKRKIIEKYAKCVCVIELAQRYDRNTSTIIKQKDYIQVI